MKNKIINLTINVVIVLAFFFYWFYSLSSNGMKDLQTYGAYIAFVWVLIEFLIDGLTKKNKQYSDNIFLSRIISTVLVLIFVLIYVFISGEKNILIISSLFLAICLWEGILLLLSYFKLKR